MNHPLLKYGFSHKYIGTDGNGRLGVLAVGEAPGQEEDLLGRPFVGAAGRLTDRMVTRAKNPVSGEFLKRDDLLFANVVNFRPPDNELAGAKYEQEAIDYCRPYLEATIEEFKPRAILAMGATAIKWFIPEAVNTRELVKDWRGYVVDTKWGTVVSTYHPAFLLRGNFALCEAFQYDLLRAVQIAENGGEFKREPTFYEEIPSVAEAWQFYDRYIKAGRPLLVFDIETPYSGQTEDELSDKSDLLREEDDPSYTIVRISFSFEPNKAISFPWIGEYIKVATALLRSAGQKGVWNESYDVPRLRANGVEVNGDILDFMWGWHFWKPHLPYGLKYAATFLTDLPQWKHQSFDRPAWYSCVDSDATIRCAIKLERLLREKDRWNLFMRHCVQASGVLRRMSIEGIPTDKALRKKAREDMESEYNQMVQDLNQMVPLDIRSKKVYKSKRETLEKKGLLAQGEWIEVDDGMPEPAPRPPKPRKQRASRKRADVPETPPTCPSVGQ